MHRSHSPKKIGRSPLRSMAVFLIDAVWEVLQRQGQTGFLRADLINLAKLERMRECVPVAGPQAATRLTDALSATWIGMQ